MTYHRQPSPFAGQPQSGEGSARRVMALFSRIRQQGLDQVQGIHDLMQWVDEDPDDRLVVEELEERVAEEEEIQRANPDPFRPTTPREPHALAGEIPIGTIPQSNGRFGLTVESLREHILCLGRTKGGKTTFIRAILKWVLQNARDVHVLVLERKAEHTELVSLPGRRLKLVTIKDLRINLLRPPVGVTPQAWATMLSQAWVDVLDVLSASSSYLIELTVQLLKNCGVLENPNKTWPNLRDLHDLIKAQKPFPSSNEARHRDTCLNRIEYLLNTLPGVFECDRGLDISEAVNQDILFLLHGIPSLISMNFVCEVIAAQVFLFRLATEGLQASLRNILVFDEALAFFRRVEELKLKPSFMASLIAQARSLGIGIIAASQYGTELSLSLLANSGLKIAVGGLGRTADTDLLAGTRPTTREQRDVMLKTNTPGHAFIADTRSSHLIECLVDWPDLPPALTQDEIARQSKATAQEFGFTTDSVVPADYMPKNRPRPKAAKGGAREALAETPRTPVPEPEGDEDWLVVLRDLAKNGFKKHAERAAALGLGISKLSSILKSLQAKGMVCTYKVPGRGRPPRDLHEVLDQGYQALGLAKPALKGKGSFLHQFYQYRVSEHFKKQGYSAEIEGLAGNKNVDVLVTHPTTGECIAVEIELGVETSDAYMENIHKDLQAGRVGSLLCLVEKDVAVEAVREHAAAAGFKAAGSRFRVALLCDYIGEEA